MAICGDACTLTGTEFASVEGHRYVIELASNEIDTRIFGDGDYGSFIACAKNGTVTIDSYLRPVVDIGDAVTVGMVVGTETFSIDCVVISMTVNVDAKDVVQFNTKLRIVDEVGIA